MTRTGVARNSIRALIDVAAESRGDAPFLIGPERQAVCTFGDLRRRAAGVTAGLAALGLVRGDRVGLLLENGLFTAELYLGSLYGGFVPVPLALGAGESELTHVLAHSGMSVVVVGDKQRSTLEVVVRRGGARLPLISADPDFAPTWSEGLGRTEPASPGDDDVADLVYTSGTTGLPRGVLTSHRSLVAGALNTVRSHALSAEDRGLCVLPLYHRNAQVTQLIAALASGGSLVVPRGFSVAAFWDWIDAFACTWVALVPTLVSRLLHSAGEGARHPRRSGASLRFARCSSTALDSASHRAFERQFGVPLLEAMGMTEASSTIFSQPLPPADRKLGSIGVPTGFEVKVIDGTGASLGDGVPGEIVVRGPSVMLGYHGDPAATAEVLDPEGWLRTGDVGYRDGDGHFFLVGRIKDLIVKGGVNIAPREIERAIRAHPAVADAAVVGTPDRYLGQEIVAFVVPASAGKCEVHELLDHCEREVGAFKTPSRIYWVSELPRGGSGKVQRHRVHELLERVDAPAVAGAGASSREELVFAQIFAEVLGFGRVGVHDDFFGLGGDSLFATQLVSRVRRSLGLELSLREVFEHSTAASLAGHVKATGRAIPEATPV